MTLKDFKKYMRENIGSTFSTTMYKNINNPEIVWSPGIRELVFVDTVKFGFKTEKGISYNDFPKASDFMVITYQNKQEPSFKLEVGFDNRYIIYTKTT